MADQKLTEYIVQATQAGQNPQDIKAALLGAGWQARDVDEALQTVFPVSVQKSTGGGKSKTLIIAVSSLAVLLLAGGGFAYWHFVYEPKNIDKPISAVAVVPQKETIQDVLARAKNISAIQFDLSMSEIENPQKVVSSTKFWQKPQYTRIDGTVPSTGMTTSSIYRPDGVFNTLEPGYYFKGPSSLPPSITNSLEQLHIVPYLVQSGTEEINGKSAIVTEYATGTDGTEVHYKIWIWGEKGLPLKIEIRPKSDNNPLNPVSKATMIEFKNYSFDDISDSIFDVPVDKIRQVDSGFPESGVLSPAATNSTTIGSESSSQESSSNLKSTKLATIILPASPFYHWDEKLIFFSPDISKVAYENADSKTLETTLEINGEREMTGGYLVSSPVFSPDGKQIAYSILSSIQGTSTVANIVTIKLNNKEVGRYKDAISGITFSPDSKHFAYIVGARPGGTPGKAFVVLDGEKGKVHDWVDSLTFSSDGKLAYIAKENKNIFAVVNGVEGKTYDSIIHSLIFSTDGSSVGYIAQKDKKYIAVINGEEKGAYSNAFVSNLTLSSYGKRFAYQVDIYPLDGNDFNKNHFIVLDGKEGEKYDIVGGFVFSQDGNRFSYMADDLKESKSFLIVDGEKSVRPYSEGFGGAIFSPDGTQIAYQVGKPGGNSAMVVNGKEGKTYHQITYPVFSPDSKHFAYRGWSNTEPGPVVVLNGKEQKVRDASDALIFSPDSQHLAYRSSKDDRAKIITVDDKEGEMYDWVWDPIFSADGKYVEYGARKGNELWRIVESAQEFGSGQVQSSPEERDRERKGNAQAMATAIAVYSSDQTSEKAPAETTGICPQGWTFYVNTGIGCLDLTSGNPPLNKYLNYLPSDTIADTYAYMNHGMDATYCLGVKLEASNSLFLCNSGGCLQKSGTTNGKWTAADCPEN